MLRLALAAFAFATTVNAAQALEQYIVPQPWRIGLDLGWQLQSSAQVQGDGAALSQAGGGAGSWYPTVVPATVLAALADNKVYPDPYYGLNLKSIPGYQDDLWLVMKEDSPFRVPWWYRTEFDVPADWAGKHVTLHLDGINYEAEVWLNGAKIAGTDAVRGMFRRFEFPVTASVKPGARHALAVKIVPPGLLPDKKYHTKQIEATTGWDDHNPQPPDMNMGLWQPVYLRAQGPVTLRHPYAESRIEWDAADPPAATRAALTVSAHLHNASDAPVTGVLRGTIGGAAVSQEVSLAAGETREVSIAPETHAALNLDAPKLWWPHPLGEPALYDARLEFVVGDAVSDTAGWRFGIREIETVINAEDWREYRVNRRKVLIRGGAWMTSDMLLRLEPRRYDALVRYAREAGFNMLRSEGFSIRETQDFYDACDEMGVMVTQQLFGRSIPDEDLAIACIDDTLLRIRNHPSLAHFLGHDETFPTERLDAAYRDLIAKHRVGRTYQPHSGAFEIEERQQTGGTRTGTRELWTYAGPSHYYLEHDYGAWGFAQSGGIGGIAAPEDSIRQMMPEDQLWPAMETEAWGFHSVMQGNTYFTAFRKAMDTSYGKPADLADFLRKAYAMNYNSARGMFEAYGRNKYAATGITTWKYDAAWPAAITWQYIDWYLRPTAAYFGAKKACEALHVQYAYDDGAVYVVNAVDAVEGLDVRATVHDFSGKTLHTQQAKADVPRDGVVKVFPVEWPGNLPNPHLLRLELRTPDGVARSINTYWLSTTPDIPTGIERYTLGGIFHTEYKSMADFNALAALPQQPVTVTAAAQGDGAVDVTIENPGPAVAFQVRADLVAGDGRALAPVYWDDNCITLLPGERRTLRAACDGGCGSARVSGWNVPAAEAQH